MVTKGEQEKVMNFFNRTFIAASLSLAVSSPVYSDIMINGDANKNIETSDKELTYTDALIVGQTSSSDALVDSGSVLNTVGGTLGLLQGSMGSMAVSGADSKWDSSRRIVVGEAGVGYLVITDGAKVNTDIDAYTEGLTIGKQHNSEGSVLVSGSGSRLDVDRNLFVGTEGSGVLDIVAGAGVTAASDLLISFKGDSKSTVNVKGQDSTLDVSGVMYIASDDSGGDNSGALNISEGGSASTTYAYIGNGLTGKGYVNVDGENSTFNVNQSIYAGRDGDGHLTVTNGGVVNAKHLIVASGSSSVGSVGVLGAGSTINLTNDIRVGYRGEGRFSISDNAVVNSKGSTTIGDFGLGAMHVSGNSIFNTGQLSVGKDGSGSLVIADGSTVNTSGVQIGTSFDFSGSDVVHVRGKGSSLTTDLNAFDYGAMFIGIGTKSGVLTISDEATVKANQFSVGTYAEDGAVSSINIGSEKGQAASGAGYIIDGYIDLVSATSELNFNHTNNDYIFSPRIQGAGIINIIAGSTTLEAVSSSFSGTTNVFGGILTSNTSLGGNVNIFSSGQMIASGDIRGDVVNSGLLKIGGAPAFSYKGYSLPEAMETLVIGGSYTGNNGTLVFDSVLGDDSSPSSKLTVLGDTNGHTFVQVNNMGGGGAHTAANGIELIEVGGESNGTFSLANRVIAGTNEYLLDKGGKSYAADGNWYLRSELPVVEPPVEPEEPTDPESPVDPQDPIKPIEPPQRKPSTPIYRPEVGAYLGNQMAATNMFQHTLHERVGELDFSERQRGEDGKASSLWM
ncbi:MAG: autotransporter outer membrane beta-barrel domain-containing protein, partial [Kaiparowitsia implicata GSE-PSE-MK54-09C]|nr:autotransporter outer membrane beta-barrel domain-containing protein [Kaiparowitsia implicata GSE-PSE-MK54-09C]